MNLITSSKPKLWCSERLAIGVKKWLELNVKVGDSLVLIMIFKCPPGVCFMFIITILWLISYLWWLVLGQWWLETLKVIINVHGREKSSEIKKKKMQNRNIFTPISICKKSKRIREFFLMFCYFFNFIHSTLVENLLTERID